VATTYLSHPTVLPLRRRPTHRPQRTSADSARFIGMAVVVGLHLVLVYGLVHVLNERTVSRAPDAIQARVIDEPQQAADQIKPPPPSLDTPPPPPFVPPVEVNIAAIAPASSAISTVSAAKPAPPPVDAPRTVRVSPELDTNRSIDPVYPAISRRMSEEGLVSLLVLVGPDGSVEDVRLEKTSGYVRLDQAAIDGARTRCRFVPGSIDGKPAALWYRYRYEFKLT
jgi:protein TonB